jgi:uncharacterized coiled-coil protein SlyX
MSDDFERRISNLERSHDDLTRTISDLNTTIALLNQTVEIMSKNEEKRQQFLDRSLLFVVGGFIAAGISWVIRGGLSDG